MTNTQKFIKLDLSSLLTETSAQSNNKYTSSALELLLNNDVDQSGAGLLDMFSKAGPVLQAAKSRVVDVSKNTVSAIGRKSPEIMNRGRQAVLSVGRALTPSPDRINKISQNVQTAAQTVRDAARESPKRIRQLAQTAQNAIRKSPDRIRQLTTRANETIDTGVNYANVAFKPTRVNTMTPAGNESATSDGSPSNYEHNVQSNDNINTDLININKDITFIKQELNEIKDALAQIVKIIQSPSA
jgi:hypothetical protein